MERSGRWTIRRVRSAVIATVLSTSVLLGGYAASAKDNKKVEVYPLPVVDEKQPGSEQLPPPDKIVGGSAATAGEFPWQARIARNGSLHCGGSLIAPQWVLTAAHCVQGFSVSSLSVVMGDHNWTSNEGTEQSRTIAQAVVHPSYSSSTYDNDIALLKLSSAVTLNSRVAVIPFATSADSALYNAGVMSTVTGWGALTEGGSSPSVLYKVQVPVVSTATCNASNAYNGQITGNMVCAGYAAGGKDSCQGDSGGPFVAQSSGSWKLSGVVSWGDGCARANKYGVYTKVSNYTSWINSYVGTVSPTSTPVPGTPVPTSTPVPGTPVPTSTPVPGGSLQNGGFESSANWVQSSTGGYAVISTTRPRSGSYSAFLGGYNSGTDNIYQSVTVPSNGVLRYYWYMSTQESGSTVYDRLYVRLYNSSGSLITTLRTWSNASTKNTWTLDTISLSAYAGQTVRVQFVGTTDSSLTTSFFVDDVTLQ
ncbi:DUF1986 domain-containing protein [Herpetosiphon gulosus]|uniref:Peptidase S1 domain-containing protein n=1 Tax=Herpetosiphon gulosus TaxID=1973496 RepID=A0ABP9X5K0_9CHLR